ncbi:CBS domain-containing protein [Mechercharimyces sp. CAU 1602]|uniref:CBS domain-containing protein n=1 Tax=Mechercharimyces sp. CAU 1602 TaxID=2973933 RepID=UPI002163465E|nr:CBS domain-containing protein [Mechercharimyces sp. CAU 1602]MCS1350166.1 CBS domain-containing protein [Mechercharimyces sp. CAU 1602]
MHQLQDIMTTNVNTVSPQDNIFQVASLMKQHNIGSVPVIENGLLCGVVTDRDLVLRGIAEQKPNSSTVESFMTPNPVVGSPDMSVDDAARLMAENQIRRLPIVDNGQLIGIVAIGDLAVRQPYADNAGVALTSISTQDQTGTPNQPPSGADANPHQLM